MVKVKITFTDGEEIAFEARSPDQMGRHLKEVCTAKAEKFWQELLEEIEKNQDKIESTSKSDDDK